MAFCYRLFNLCIVGARAWFSLPAISQTSSQSGQVLFIIFMDRISRRSQVMGVGFGGLQITSLTELIADDVVLLASSNSDL